MHNTRFLENMKSFGYQVPKDPEKLLYDFYFMVGYIHGDREDKIIDFVFKEAVKDCVTALHKHMLMALLWSLSCEARHAEEESNIEGLYEDFLAKEDYLDSNALKYIPFWQSYFDNYNTFLATKRLPNITVKTASRIQNLSKSGVANDLEKAMAKFMMQAATMPTARKNAFRTLLATKEKAKFSALDLANAFIFLFKDPEWADGYGGDNWADIAIAYKKLLESTSVADKIVWIDHAYDLQHNNGTVFSKVTSYDKEGFSWLRRALYWKKNIEDLRGFYDKVSGSLKPVVAWVAKNEHGKALDTYNSGEITVGDFVVVKNKLQKDFIKEAGFWGWSEDLLDSNSYLIVTNIVDYYVGAEPDVVSILLCDKTGWQQDTAHEIPLSYFEKDTRKLSKGLLATQAEVLSEDRK